MTDDKNESVVANKDADGYEYKSFKLDKLTAADVDELVARGQLVLADDAEYDEAKLVHITDVLFRRLSLMQGAIQANSDASDAEIAEIEARFDIATKPYIAQEHKLLELLNLVGHVMPFHGKKSRDTAFGTLGFRTTPLKVEIDDPKALQMWEIDNGMTGTFIEEVKTVTMKVRKLVIVKYIKEKGDIPDGVTAHHPQQKFFANTTELPKAAIADTPKAAITESVKGGVAISATVTRGGDDA